METGDSVQYRVLIVDDEEIARTGLSRILQRPDLQVDLAENGEEALKKIRDEGLEYHVVITDYRMPRVDGRQLLDTLVKLRPLTKVIMVTGKGSTATAVECIKAGAYDYIEKPFDIVLIRTAVERALREAQLAEDNVQLKKTLSVSTRSDQTLAWEDPAMDRTVLLAQKLALTDDPILIEGESGTGKELLAHMVHNASRLRAKKFLAVNCGAFSEEILVSELFGHERGAFTGATEMKQGFFESVAGGSLFLDEIGDLPLSMQAKFLRVLEQKEILRVGGRTPIPVSFRLIAASHRNLAEMATQNLFRTDLYYRLNVHLLKVPPLRDRPQDVLVLFDHFCRKIEREGHGNRPPAGLSDDACELLLSYAWPGNVRELSNVVKKLAVVAGGRVAQAEDLPDALRTAPARTRSGVIKVPSPDTLVLADMKLEHVRQALEKTEGNRTHAAKLLGMSRVSLHRFLLRHPELSRVGRDSD